MEIQPVKKTEGRDKFEVFHAKRSGSGIGSKRTTPRNVPQGALRFRQTCALLLTWIITAFLVIYVISFSSYQGIEKWDQVAYAGMMSAMCHFFLLLDNYDKFHWLHTFLERMCYGRGQTSLSVAFMVLGFADYIMIEVYYSLLNEEGPMFLFVTLYIVYYISLILLFFTWIAWWDVFAFYCAEYSYMHGFMYISVLGGIVLFFARWIRPSRQGDWHHHPGTDIVLNGILNVISFFFVLLVVLAGIGIPMFSEFGQSVHAMGKPVAITLLIVVSMIVMLTPLAPANIVDVCGGFVLVQILRKQENFAFWEAWIISYCSVCVLRFAGACAQWYIGKQPCPQAYGNATLPVPMLAASDAVLKDADWCRVGLIAYLFMDTSNGLNQGRSNMEFHKLLLSKWTCFFNALPWVSLGATVAVSGDKSLEWTRLALPVLLLFGTCWQMLGMSYGANAIGSSMDKTEYWQSREKWTITQFFFRAGYTPTQTGWKNDVYQLANIKQEIYGQDANRECLYAKICKVHMSYLKERDALLTDAGRIERYQYYKEEVSHIREWHIINLNAILEATLKNAWLIYKEPEKSKIGWFNREENIRYKMVIICLLVVCYWVSIVGIWNEVYMREAVSKGLRVLDTIAKWAWVGFTSFIVLELIYFHVQLMAGFKSMGRICCWFFHGCKFDARIETRLNTPHWDCPLINKRKKRYGMMQSKQAANAIF